MAIEITFDAPGIADLEEALHRFAVRGVPYAARNALNASAFEARRGWVDRAEDTFTLRNTWTTRTLQVAKAKGRNVDTMRAVVGSTAPYMAAQEEGDTLRRRGKHGVGVPTSVASGEGRNAIPRKRRVRRPNRMGQIHLTDRPSGMPRRQRNAVAIRIAMAKRERFVFLEMERGAGIFRIFGGKRRPRFELVWDLSRASIRIPPTRTLEKTLESIAPRLPALHVRAIEEQLRRNGVGGF